jgi:hypothetical protein
MTTFEELDKQLAARGWHYDRGNERFMAGTRELTWEDVIRLVRGTNLDEPVSYQNDKWDNRLGS